uniref:Uncharacterized protein n=1 Tax=Lepeophtheirus salmonis TaxID=72036 RepID=A0A0K2V239_LEPSM
MELIPNRTEIS